MNEAAPPEKNPSTQERTPLNIREVFLRAGLNLEEIGESIIGRLELLAEFTPTVEDEMRAIHYAERLFRYYETAEPNKSFSEIEKRIVIVGTLFSDIGKTGPPDASYEEQRLIAEIFAVENVGDPKRPLKDFLHDYFPQDADARITKLTALGIDPQISMREFWNHHGLWTLQIVKGDGVPEEAVAAAATHHMLEGVNPENIVGLDNRFAKYFGENTTFDRSEKLVILLDKYDARRRRGRKTHEESIAYLRNLIAHHPRYPNDPEFLELIGDMQKVLSKETDS